MRKITCGKSYVLAVSDASEIYSWGQNDAGQLGFGDTESGGPPDRPIGDIGKYVSLWITSSQDFSYLFQIKKIHRCC